jgi:hypothetical protein
MHDAAAASIRYQSHDSPREGLKTCRRARMRLHVPDRSFLDDGHSSCSTFVVTTFEGSLLSSRRNIKLAHKCHLR